MKKIFILLIMIMAIGQIQGVYAQSDNIDDGVEEVSIGYSSPDLNERDIYSGYTTINKNEITMITHFLESLKQTEGGGVPSDSTEIRITLTNDSGVIKSYTIYPSILQTFKNSNNNKYGYGVYKFPITDYYRMCDFINSLILNKFDNSTMVSTEPSNWAKEYVDEAIMDGLIPEWNQIGYTNYIPRVEVCQLVDNLLTAKGIDKKVPNDYTYLKEYPFEDTKDISVKELYLQGIVNGKSETEFCPYDYITREEFSRVLSEVYKVVSKTASTASSVLQYKDKAQISDWALGSVTNVTSLGLMQGDENGNFNPKGNITKEEVIVTLLRLYDLN
jgi:hypothetical protein